MEKCWASQYPDNLWVYNLTNPGLLRSHFIAAFSVKFVAQMDPKPKYITAVQVWMMDTGAFADLSVCMLRLTCVTVFFSNGAELRHELKDCDDVIVTSKVNGQQWKEILCYRHRPPEHLYVQPTYSLIISVEQKFLILHSLVHLFQHSF